MIGPTVGVWSDVEFSGGVGPPPYIPALKFNDARNSMYVGLA